MHLLQTLSMIKVLKCTHYFITKRIPTIRVTLTEFV